MENKYRKTNNQNQKEIEKRVQISKEMCNSETKNPSAKENSKQKSNNSSYSYSKIDEKITTKEYKIPENNYVNENKIITEEEYNENIGRNDCDYENNQYDPYYEEQYEYEGNNIYNTDYKSSKFQARNNYYNSNYNNTDYYNKNSNFRLEYVSSINPRNM